VSRSSREKGVDATNILLGIMTIVVLGLLGWAVATQVQVSRVADRIGNATFRNLTVATFQILQNLTSTTSPLFVRAENINTTEGTFYFATRLTGQTSFSGAKTAVLTVWAVVQTTFTGDGTTVAQLAINMSNTNGVLLASVPGVFNFVQFPILFVGEDGLAPQGSFVSNEPGTGLTLTQLGIAIIPSVGSPPQKYTSQLIEIVLGDYFPQLLSS
jgi:hypothetical protein